MRRVVQIRGTTGSGKTTAMRYAIAKAGGGEIVVLKGAGGDRNCTLTPKFLALGDYLKRAACVGCDRFDDANDTKAVLVDAMRNGYEVIAFEGMILSHTFKFAKDVQALAEEFGYTYECVFLNADFENALSRIFERNNAKPIKYDKLMDKVIRFTVAEQKIVRHGIKSVVLNTNEMNKESVGEAVYEAIVS